MKRKCLKGLCLLLTVGMLEGCTAANDNPQSGENVNTSVESTESVEQSTETISENSQASNEETTQTIEEPAPVVQATFDEFTEEVEIPEGITQLTFSGNMKDQVVSEDYSIYVSDKYILLVDKGLELPGNYPQALDDIAVQIEENTGFSFKTEKKDFYQNMEKTFEGDTPWKGLKSGDKFIIQLNNKESAGDGNVNSYVIEPPILHRGYMVAYDCALGTMPGSSFEEADYYRAIECLLAGIYAQYYPQFDVEDDGWEYVEEVIIKAMTDQYPDFKRIGNVTEYVDVPVYTEGSEVEVKWNVDHNSLNWSERRSLEIYFFKYMMETQGKDFLTKIFDEEDTYRNASRDMLTRRMTEVFGDDIFDNFVVWLLGGSVEVEKAEALTLDSSKSGFFEADKYYFVEGEYCFVYIEKGANVPYDYVENADAIVEELGKEMWDLQKKTTFEESNVGVYKNFYGISNNGKLPIYIGVDEENLGLISNYDGSSVIVYDFGMEKKDIKLVEYDTLAHESSHAMMNNCGEMDAIGRIMTEGTADFYAQQTIQKTGIKTNLGEQFYNYDVPINAETAEELFFNDYADVSHADRGAEYHYGYYFSIYLNETYGPNFLKDVTDALRTAGISDQGTEEDCTKRVEIFKQVFGEDVFTLFGEWYVNNQ